MKKQTDSFNDTNVNALVKTSLNLCMYTLVIAYAHTLLRPPLNKKLFPVYRLTGRGLTRIFCMVPKKIYIYIYIYSSQKKKYKKELF